MNIKSYAKAFIVGHSEKKANIKKLKEVTKNRPIVNLAYWKLNHNQQTLNQ